MNIALSKLDEWLREPGLRTEILSNGEVLKWVRVDNKTLIVHITADERPWIFYVQTDLTETPTAPARPPRRYEDDEAPLKHGPGTGCICTACQTWEA